MKKLLPILLTLLAVLAFGLTACAPNEETGNISSVVPDPPSHTESGDTGNTGGNDDTPNASNEESGHTYLIAYFSLTEVISEGANASSSATPYAGNTESVAKEIQKQIGGDLFKIQTVKTYPTSHSECSKVAEQEMRSNARPELSSHVDDMEKYDVVFVGYPIWWYREPMAIRTFLDEYKFGGKTIIPFCTTLGAGISQSMNNISGQCPNSTVVKGLSLSTGRADNSVAVKNWLTEIGLIKGV